MKPTLLLAAPLLALEAAAAPPPPVQAGDPVNGALLFRLHCSGCHGADGTGNGFLAKILTSPSPDNLRDAGFLLRHGDEDLHGAIVRGGAAVGAHFTMPAFGGVLDTLDSWDVVAFLRRGQLSVADFFPQAARYAAKSYTLDDDARKRLEEILGKLTEREERITVASVFGAEKPSLDGPVLVPQEPRELDTLKPKQKVGYVSFVEVAVPGVAPALAVWISMSKEGVIESVRARLDGVKDKDRPRVEKLFAGFEGQGGKQSPERKDYKNLKPGKGAGKDAAAVAKALTRSYYRALEGAIMFDKEERERHWAD
jgi:mono/diheme cytochrome c family protein